MRVFGHGGQGCDGDGPDGVNATLNETQC